MKARATAMTRMPSTMGLSARLAGARARARGVALRPLLEKAGLNAREFADARVRLPTGNQIVFLNLVAEALADDMLGLSLALDYECAGAGCSITCLLRPQRSWTCSSAAPASPPSSTKAWCRN